MDGKTDLHIHTLYSDGALSPAEIVPAARNAGLDCISITDHDTVSALDVAIELGRTHGVEVIPGVELSAAVDDTEIHILGYFFDYQNKSLRETLAEFREERLRRAERIVSKLNRMNIPLSMESVLANVTGESVGRPHIATALVNGGHANSYHQAFSKYIGDGRPAYERKTSFTPADTVRLIADAGGLSFLAHPGRMVSEEMLLALLKSGLDGIEVIHPSHTPDLVRHYRGIVNEYFLLESGGSDFHGGLKGDEHLLGEVALPISVVDAMRHRLTAH